MAATEVCSSDLPLGEPAARRAAGEQPPAAAYLDLPKHSCWGHALPRHSGSTTAWPSQSSTDSSGGKPLPWASHWPGWDLLRSHCSWRLLSPSAFSSHLFFHTCQTCIRDWWPHLLTPATSPFYLSQEFTPINPLHGYFFVDTHTNIRDIKEVKKITFCLSLLELL